MVDKTLSQDIETASYYELVAWCRLLGLDEAGDKPALIQKLKTHLNVQSSDEKKEIIKTIDITSARSSEYFSLDDIKEDYVLIRGGVTAILTDNKKNARHTIQAERILYNQTTDTLTASGNVVYRRKIGDKEESFTGETFVFNASNSEGVIYHATGSRSQKMDDVEVMFHYRGETVTRLKDDAVLLEKGVITSSPNPDHSNYRIKADRIWVYSPGEWAIQNAVLYLGNIPVLYLPFYYYTSEELFFNPVYGFKIREGAFWQNTIYLIGKKKREADALSFMQLENSNDQDTEMQLHGLFLKPVPKTMNGAGGSTTPAVEQKKAAIVKHLKLFFDIYSRLGLFGGLNLDAAPDITLNVGVGVSRSIFQSGSSYTVYYGGQDYLNWSNIFGLSMPVRYGLETQFKTSLGIIQRLEGNMSYFSDPFFPVDFYSREENQDWGKIIGFEIPTTTTSTPALNTLRTTLSWFASSAFDFSRLFQTSLLQTLKIDPFGFSFDWGSNTVNTSSDPILAADPARMFYYPQRITFPNFTLTAGGTLLEYVYSNQVPAVSPSGQTQTSAPSSTKSAGGAAFAVTQPFLPPDASAEGAAPPPPDEPALRRPDMKQDVQINRTVKYFSARLFYSLNQQFKAEHLFANDPLNLPNADAVAFYTRNSIYYNSGTTALNYELVFWEILKIAGGVSIGQKYQVTSSTPFEGFNQTATDKIGTSLDFIDSFQVVCNPFKGIPDFQLSEFSYNLKWNFFNIAYSTAYNAFQENPFLFNKSTVTLHQAIANLVFQPEDKPNTLKLTAAIPPSTGSYKAELNFFFWIFQTNAYAEYKELADSSWLLSPVKVTETAAIPNFMTVSTSLSHDQAGSIANDWWSATANLFFYKYMNADHYFLMQDVRYNFSSGVNSFDIIRTVVDLWNLKSSFLWERMVPLTPLGNPIGAEMEFVFHTFNLSYKLSLPELYGWKNRISFSTSVNTDLLLDFQKIINSKFTLQLEFMLKIHKFLDISFKTEVYNNNVYRYVPWMVDQVNADPQVQSYGVFIPLENPFLDLLRSFNFFNINDRYASFFKLKTLAFDITHYLDDWILKLGFTGSFQFTTSSTYEFIPAFTFSLKWVPIPQIKKEFTGDQYGLKL